MKKILIILSLLLNGGCSSVRGKTNEEWMKLMKSMETEMELPAMKLLSDDELFETLHVNAEDLDSYLVLLSMMSVHATEILIFQIKEDKVETVRSAVSSYLGEKEQKWSSSLSDQYDLIKNRIEKMVGDSILVVIVSEDSSRIESKIDAALDK